MNDIYENLRSHALQARESRQKAGIEYDSIQVPIDIVLGLVEEFEALENVVGVAREFLSHNGPFVASDGYVSIAVGDTRPLRDALAEFDGYLTKVPDSARIYEDPDEGWGEYA